MSDCFHGHPCASALKQIGESQASSGDGQCTLQSEPSHSRRTRHGRKASERNPRGWRPRTRGRGQDRFFTAAGERQRAFWGGSVGGYSQDHFRPLAVRTGTFSKGVNFWVCQVAHKCLGMSIPSPWQQSPVDNTPGEHRTSSAKYLGAPIAEPAGVGQPLPGSA